jgi:hypothetical protein
VRDRDRDLHRLAQRILEEIRPHELKGLERTNRLGSKERNLFSLLDGILLEAHLGWDRLVLPTPSQIGGGVCGARVVTTGHTDLLARDFASFDEREKSPLKMIGGLCHNRIPMGGQVGGVFEQ